MNFAAALPRRPVRILCTPAVLFGALLLAGCATTGADGSRQDASPLAERAGTGIASVLASAVYTPTKVVYAATGTIVGGGAYLFSGGNRDVAKAVIGPAVGGHYIVTPERLGNLETLEFVGTGYEVVGRSDEPEIKTALPPVATPAPPACARLGTFPSVFFESGKTALNPTAIEKLQEAAAVMRDCPLASAEIRAFSDALGSRKTNLKLSRKRAEAVRAYLVTDGVSDERLHVFTFGEDNPVAVNATKAGRAANRRVEVTLR